MLKSSDRVVSTMNRLACQRSPVISTKLIDLVGIHHIMTVVSVKFDVYHRMRLIEFVYNI
jgi:hypothetical protein